MEVRTLGEADRAFVAALCRRHFGSEVVAARGSLHQPHRLEGLVAWQGGARVGALSYRPDADGAEVVLLAADRPGRGVGTALLGAVEALARQRGWPRLRLLTTNDNTPMLTLCRRRGWEQVGRQAGAVEADRRLKPEIPERGVGGVPIRDLLEFEHRPGDGKGRA